MKSFLEFTRPDKNEGVYMCVKFSESSNDIFRMIQEKMQLKNPVASHKFHCTVVYSRKNVDLFPETDIYESASITGIEVWDTQYGKTVVALLDSPYLVERFDDAMEAGATYDFPDYRPHVTLSYDGETDVFFDFRKHTLTFPYQIAIVSEEVEILDLDQELNDLTERGKVG